MKRPALSAKQALIVSAFAGAIATGPLCRLVDLEFTSSALAEPTVGTASDPTLANPAGVQPDRNKAVPTVELSSKQLGMIKIGTASRLMFQSEKSAIGSVDFNQDALVQVFTPYQGRIISVFVQIDDKVKIGQPLYTIDSPDLLQAESTLIQTAGLNDLTTRALSRARRLVPAGGGAQKDLDQAISDQQTAEGNLKTARDILHIFGKSDADIDAIVDNRRVDSTMVIKSPAEGLVTARNAAPGLFVQPGSVPAPVSVANIATKWMVASFAEDDSLVFRVGQDIEGQVLAIPGQTFKGRLTAIGETIDPATRRIMVRSEIADPDNVLRPGMFASFVIKTGRPLDNVAMPVSGVVREGDGTMTVWVTRDNRHFMQRIVKLGLQQNGFDQVVEGLQAGETVAVDGAVFLSNILNAPPSD